MNEARIPVAPRAPDARTARPVGFVEQDPARRVERVIAAPLQITEELLDARLVRHRGPGVLLAPSTFGRVFTMVAVHLVEPLGLRVVRLEIVVRQWPGRGQSVDVLQVAEVLGTEPVQRSPVHLRRTADEVVHLRLERGAVSVVPRVGRDVLPLDEDLVGIPVRHLTREEVAAFEQQDAFPRRGERVRQCPTTRAGPDDDHIEALWHVSCLSPAT